MISASYERSFSKLKSIKFYLRSLTNHDRLNRLSIISIEQQVVKNLDYDGIMNDLAVEKVSLRVGNTFSMLPIASLRVCLMLFNLRSILLDVPHDVIVRIDSRDRNLK